MREAEQSSACFQLKGEFSLDGLSVIRTFLQLVPYMLPHSSPQTVPLSGTPVFAVSYKVMDAWRGQECQKPIRLCIKCRNRFLWKNIAGIQVLLLSVTKQDQQVTYTYSAYAHNTCTYRCTLSHRLTKQQSL